MVGIRVTVSLRFRVLRTLRHTVEFRFKAWLGFRCISVGIRNDRWRVLITVVAVGYSRNCRFTFNGHSGGCSCTRGCVPSAVVVVCARITGVQAFESQSRLENLSQGK